VSIITEDQSVKEITVQTGIDHNAVQMIKNCGISESLLSLGSAIADGRAQKCTHGYVIAVASTCWLLNIQTGHEIWFYSFDHRMASQCISR
jgi:hypothetical protein